jgi:hypothetical protein
MDPQTMRTAWKLVHRAGACDIQFLVLTKCGERKWPNMVELCSEAAQ